MIGIPAYVWVVGVAVLVATSALVLSHIVMVADELYDAWKNRRKKKK